MDLAKKGERGSIRVSKCILEKGKGFFLFFFRNKLGIKRGLMSPILT